MRPLPARNLSQLRGWNAVGPQTRPPAPLRRVSPFRRRPSRPRQLSKPKIRHCPILPQEVLLACESALFYLPYNLVPGVFHKAPEVTRSDVEGQFGVMREHQPSAVARVPGIERLRPEAADRVREVTDDTTR